MSAKVSGIVWESSLDRPLKYVLLALSDHAKHDGSDVYPSIALIMYKTGYSERQTQDLLKNLRDIGILVLVEAGGRGPGSTNKYRIAIEKIPMLPNFEEWKQANGIPTRDAKTAPLPETAKGAISSEKGCDSDEKRVRPTAPEPNTPRTSKDLEPKSSADATPPAGAQAPPKKKKVKAEKPADERHGPFVEEWKAQFLAHPENHDAESAPWCGSCAGMVATILRGNPRWTGGYWRQLCANYFASGNTVATAHAHERFLKHYSLYVRRPLTQFGSPDMKRGPAVPRTQPVAQSESPPEVPEWKRQLIEDHNRQYREGKLQPDEIEKFRKAGTLTADGEPGNKTGQDK